MSAVSPGVVLALAATVLRRHLVPFAVVAVGVRLPVILIATRELPGAPDGLSRVNGILSTVLGTIGAGALTAGTLRSLRGEPVDARRILREGFVRLVPVFTASMLSGLAVLLGLILLVVPGLVFVAAFWLAVPAVMAERGLGGRAALDRSWALTRGQRLPVFAVAAVAVLLGFGAPLAGSLLLDGLEGLSAGWTSGVTELLVALGSGASSVVTAVCYAEARRAREGEDFASTAAVFD